MKYHVNYKNEIQKSFTIKEIFKEHWDSFVKSMVSQNKPIRPVIMDEVEKVIGCQDQKNGHTLYFCTNCKSIQYVAFTCESRFCNCCGVKYFNDRALSITSKLIDCPHRHIVFTIPDLLRKYLALERSLLALLFKAASQTVLYNFNKLNKSEDFTPGMVCVLHTLGRDLKWNPHIHMIVSEGAIGRTGWKLLTHINFEALRHSWQYLILKSMKQHIVSKEFKELVDALYIKHQNGFYVRAVPNKNMNNTIVANYIVSYIGRPVMAQSRILNYDGQNITFWYKPHGSEGVIIETIPTFEFIKKLIIHIPNKNFKMLRSCGLYCVRHTKHAFYLRMNRSMTKR